MADTNNTKLFEDFPSISYKEWMDKITVDLKGADFTKKLVWKTNDGFNVNPFYRQEDLEKISYLDTLPGEFPFVRGTKKDNNDWFVRQDIHVKDVKEANAKALDLLNKGVDSLGFCFYKADTITKENIAALLEGICLDAIEVNFAIHKNALKCVELFVAYVEEKGYNKKTIKGAINYDPYGRLLCKGTMAGNSEATALEPTIKMIAATKSLPNFKVITVNAKHINNAGGNITQELGYALSMGNEYLAKLTEAGVSAYDVATNIKFHFGISSNYFMEIAKFRAARLTWAQIVAQYKPTCDCGSDCNDDCNAEFCSCAAKIQVHAETSKWNMTLFDPNVNMLRSQTEAMSAGIAGIDSLTVLPFDITFKEADTFSERIARNQQLLLKEESYIAKIADVSAGSYYIEELTDSVATAAWAIFTTVEDNGGFFKSVIAGNIQADVKASATKRRQMLAQRREVLLGTNQFPNFSEMMSQKIAKNDACCCSSTPENQMATPLEFGRASEEFETLRLATEKATKRPLVYMLKVGNVNFRQARGQFASNFFACAGYDVVDKLGHANVEAGVKEAISLNADIVVICSSDDEYATAAPEAYKLLKDKAIFVVAGNPSCTEELKAQNIDKFIHVRSNVLEELKAYNAALGI